MYQCIVCLFFAYSYSITGFFCLHLERSCAVWLVRDPHGPRASSLVAAAQERRAGEQRRRGGSLSCLGSDTCILSPFLLILSTPLPYTPWLRHSVIFFTISNSLHSPTLILPHISHLIYIQLHSYSPLPYTLFITSLSPLHSF